MESMIGGVIFGLCLFILPLWAYRRGLRDGLTLNQGKTIEPIKSPLQVVEERKERREEVKKQSKADEDMAQGLANLMSYDGSPQVAAKVGDK